MNPNTSWSADKSDLLINTLVKFINSPHVLVQLFIAQNINEVIPNYMSEKIFQDICLSTFEILKTAVSICFLLIFIVKSKCIK